MIRPFIDSMSHSMSPVGSGSHRILGSGASAAATPPGGEKNKQSAKPRAEKPTMPTSPTSERNNPVTKQSTANSKKTVDHKPILFGDKNVSYSCNHLPRPRKKCLFPATVPNK